MTAEEEEAFRSYRPRPADLFTGDVVKEVLSKADAGVAGGCSGWRNEHFKGAKNMAVDVRGIEDLTSAVADKFKLTSEFVLTCWDLGHEKDVWLDDNNMLKVSEDRCIQLLSHVAL